MRCVPLCFSLAGLVGPRALEKGDVPEGIFVILDEGRSDRKGKSESEKKMLVVEMCVKAASLHPSFTCERFVGSVGLVIGAANYRVTDVMVDGRVFLFVML